MGVLVIVVIYACFPFDFALLGFCLGVIIRL